MKLIYLVVGVVVVTILAASAYAAVFKPSTQNVISSQATNFELAKVGGGQASLADFKGKVVLVNFWASWCGTCRDEMPDIIETYHKYRDRGFEVIGVNYGESTDPAAHFITTFGMDFTNLMDPDKAVAKLYRVSATPTSFLIDRHGTIRDFAATKINFTNLSPEIEKLLAEQ